MMTRTVGLARNAATEALRVRRRHGLQLWQAICVYDLAEQKLGLKVYFDAIPSMEGMYMDGSPPRIILSSVRPQGRMVYTCAHEIGHYIFGHGARVDDVGEAADGSTRWVEREEYLAECFAGFLLMPKVAVSHGFARRKWDISECTPEQLYVVAGWLGVGYTTLIGHMSRSLKAVPSERARQLAKIPLKRIRASIFGEEVEAHVVVVDQHWFGRPIDVQVGDLILFRHRIEFEGNCIEPMCSFQRERIYQAVCPGIGRCFGSGREWAEFVRVSRKEYVGQCRYRHLEDPEYEY